MKPIKSIAHILFIVVALSSCTPKMTFLNSTIAPAATGGITVKKDKNSNYVMNVSVMNLAEPKQLTPPKETYIVWMESDDNSTKKLGQIAPRSKALKGELRATSVDKPKEIYITAENDANITYPTGDTILTTKR
ncbi:hypothetical protein [Spirosoma lituiforme]|jgi:hypothetical protein